MRARLASSGRSELTVSDDARRDQSAPDADRRRKSRYEGIVLRHARGCRSRAGGGCSCTPTFQAQVWSARERKTIRKTFATLSEARAWRQESQVALRKGTLRSPSPTTLPQAAESGSPPPSKGVVRTRSGDAYKPSAIRAYRQALNHRVLPLRAANGSPRSATTCSKTSPTGSRRTAFLRARSETRSCRCARSTGALSAAARSLSTRPSSLTLPAVRGIRDRIAAPTEIRPLLDALPAAERAIYATALYAGLRLGELQALDWLNIDFETNLDPRRTKLGPPRRLHRAEEPRRQPSRPDHPNSPPRTPQPPTPTRQERATRLRLPQHTRHQALQPRHPQTPHQQSLDDNGLNPISLHECRHSYAAYMIAAGINTKALSTYMGHCVNHHHPRPLRPPPPRQRTPRRQPPRNLARPSCFLNRVHKLDSCRGVTFDRAGSGFQSLLDERAPRGSRCGPQGSSRRDLVRERHPSDRRALAVPQGSPDRVRQAPGDRSV